MFFCCSNLPICIILTLNFIKVPSYSSHRQINCGINTQGSVLGWERPACVLYNNRVPGADVAVDNKLVIKTTLCASVVGLADRQEVG